MELCYDNCALNGKQVFPQKTHSCREEDGMKKFWSWLKNEESGQGMVEYGLIVAAIAVVVLAAVFALGGTIKGIFTNVNTQLSSSSH